MAYQILDLILCSAKYAVYLHEFILHMKQCVQIPEKAELIGVATKPLYRVC